MNLSYSHYIFLFVIILFSFSYRVDADADSEKSYSDISGHWAETAIKKAADFGLV